MANRRKQVQRRSPGAAPGTLVYLGEEKTEQVQVTLIDYDRERLEERDVETIAELAARKASPTVTWVNVVGLHETGILEQLGKVFDLHPLVLEDVLNTDHRPKMESHEDYIFVVLKMLLLAKGASKIRFEQVSLVLGPGYVLSFQEETGDVFDPVRQRIRSQKGRICKMGPDYLLYALVDAVVDHYFVVLETIEGQLEVLEDAVFQDPSVETLVEIQQLKTELLRFRKAVWPIRETVNGLLREESELIAQKTEVFLRDVYDHTIQVIDTLESFRDTVSGLMDVYLSSLSNRMNEVMKVLTIIATIFIPLTFIAGIYGMNFDFMPELRVSWAYPVVLLVMLVVALFMLVRFKKKNWI